eukprot:8826013-Pyramimonas_sp.AAC.1
MQILPPGLVGGPLYGATEHVRCVPNRIRWRHVGPAAGTVEGAPYGATKRARGVLHRARKRHAGPA